MGNVMQAIEILGIPGTVGVAIVTFFLISQIIGEVVELRGKVAPEFFKIRKFFKRKKEENKERTQLLKEVRQLIEHYSADNIAKRDNWMRDVDNRAVTCGGQMTEMRDALSEMTQALSVNTKMTEDLFIENSRDRIIDFAEKASNHDVILSHEQFRRIFRVYECYEEFLAAHNRTNGEVDIAYEMIQEGFRYRMQNQCFVEDLKGYAKSDDK